MRRAFLCAALALALAACGPLPTPVIRLESSTKAPRPARTHRPTKTPTMEPTATELLLPTEQSPLALSTPRPITPTLPFAVLPSTSTSGVPFVVLSSSTPPVATASAPATPVPLALDCKLIWQSPPNGSTFDTGDKFSVGWKLKNIGTATWTAGSFEFVYLAGSHLATHDSVVPMKQSVSPGQTVVLSLPIKTPANIGTYTTHWGIRQGNNYFCRLTLTIFAR